jgi:hypothetical protein
VTDPVGGTVGHRPSGPERGPAPPDGLDHGVRADDVEVGILLAGEAGERQILGRGRGPDRHGGEVAHRGVGRAHSRVHLGRDGRGHDHLPRAPRQIAQRLRCLGAHAVEMRCQRLQLLRRRHLVCHGGKAEPARHGKPCSGELSEVQGLAAHRLQAGRAQAREIHHEAFWRNAVCRTHFLLLRPARTGSPSGRLPVRS